MKSYLLLLSWFLINGNIYSQAKFSLTLRVEGSTSYTAYHNEPLIFTVGLINQQYQNDLQWNLAADNYLARVAADYQAGKVTQEEFEKETALVTNGKRQLKADTIGSKRRPWFRQVQFRIFLNGMERSSWPIRILGDPPTNRVAILNEDGYYRVKYHLDPTKVWRLRRGTYTVKCSLAGATSNPVTVTILKEKIPPNILNSTTMQLRLGNYYLQKNDSRRSIRFATSVLKKNDGNINALVLRGEGFILRHRYNLALRDFEKALQEHQKNVADAFDEPLYLLITIGWLNEKAVK
jgi:tetratricopeptide (TPR) repeat protein